MAGAAVLASAGVARADDAPAPAASTDDPPASPADAQPAESIIIEQKEMGIPVETGTLDPITVEMGEIVSEPEPRPTLEVSTWLRLGYGEESHALNRLARTITPLPTAERSDTWEAAAGADFSLPVALAGDLRLGGWAEARTSSGPVFGVEL